MTMVGILNKKTLVFDTKSEFEHFENAIKNGVSNNITKADLDKKTKNINIVRVNKLNEK
ncbi:hypothetical protein AB0X46_03220 [Ligilactobacillus salivarius]